METATTYNMLTMTDENTSETVETNVPPRTGIDIPWNRVEGVVAVGALLTSFIWFLGMPTGMAVGVGFGIVLLLDFIRSMIFESAESDRDHFSLEEVARH